MNTDDEVASQCSQPDRQVRNLLKLAIGVTLIVVLSGGWLLYQFIWSVDGPYAHLRHIKVPDNLTSDTYTTPSDIDAGDKRWRAYTVEQPLEASVAFQQRELPRAGWTIVQQGLTTTIGESKIYCIKAQQHHTTAYLYIQEDINPDTGKVVSTVVTSLTEPRGACYTFHRG